MWGKGIHKKLKHVSAVSLWRCLRKCIVLSCFPLFLQLVSASYQLQGLHTWRFKTEPGRNPKGGKSIARVWAKQEEGSELEVWGRVELRRDWSRPSGVCYAAEWRLLGCFLPSVELPVFQNYKQILTACQLFLHQSVFQTTLTLPLWVSTLLSSLHRIPVTCCVTCVGWDMPLASPSVWNTRKTLTCGSESSIPRWSGGCSKQHIRRGRENWVCPALRQLRGPSGEGVKTDRFIRGAQWEDKRQQAWVGTWEFCSDIRKK